MKDAVINALVSYFTGKIRMHVANVNVMLQQPLAIHDHTDFTSAVEGELEKIAEYEDKLAALTKHFIGG